MKNWSKTLRINLAALLAGVALTLAFAPYNLFPLAIIGPAVLLALWLNNTPWRAFYLGFIFGLGLFGSGIYWLYTSIHLFGDIPNFLACILTAGVIAIFAVFPATVGYITNRYFPQTTTANLIYAFPAIWVLSEWIRSWTLTGFPWLFLGYSQTQSPLKGFAPILSVYGVSLAVAILAGLLVNAWLQYKQRDYRALSLNVLSFCSIWIAGALLSFIPWTQPQGKPIQLSLVQGNVPQSIKWEPEHIKLSFDRYENMTTPLWDKDKLIIWPEAAIPMPLQETPNFIEMLNQKAKASGASLIIGIPLQEVGGYRNGILMLDGSGQAQMYRKRRLVPFGEYLPLEEWLTPILNKMEVPVPNLVPGKMVQEPLMFGEVKILPAICYEIAFPELMYTSDESIGFLLTLTNDAWFGESSAQAQHLQMAAMRAIELGRPVVFVGNDGITAVIDTTGKITAAAPTHEQYVLNSSVQPTYGLTPWMKNGIDPILLLVICLLIAAIRAKKTDALKSGAPASNK